MVKCHSHDPSELCNFSIPDKFSACADRYFKLSVLNSIYFHIITASFLSKHFSQKNSGFSFHIFAHSSPSRNRSARNFLEKFLL